MVHDAGAASVGQKLGAITEQSARRDLVEKSHHSLPRILHLEHRCAARAELLDHDAEKFLGNIDRKLFVRLESLALRPLTAGQLQSLYRTEWVAVPATTVGSDCSLLTTANTVVPGTVKGNKRTIWNMGKVDVFDGGSDGVANTDPNTLFLTQGVWVP